MSTPPIPKLDRQPLTVDFIENRLPKHHPAFVDPPVRYDPMSREYIPISQAMIPRPQPGAVVVSEDSANFPHDSQLVPRPVLADIKVMKYWNGIFPEAMNKFRSTQELKGSVKPAYNIRDKHDWDELWDTLEAARTVYQNNTGRLGSVRMVRRKLADNITPFAEVTKTASKIAPNDPYVTPVLGSVGVLLEAIKTAAGVRTKVLRNTEIDGLITVFSDVELFLGTFPNDVNIHKAAVELTVATFDAIERAIGFFLRHGLKKATSAFFMGSDYETDMIQSLQTVEDKSQSLMQEASKSHIYESLRSSRETQKVQREILDAAKDAALSFNAIKKLLDDHKALVEQKNAENEETRRQCMSLQIENQQLRSASPFQQMMWAPPPPQPQAPVVEWHISQETLRRVLDTPDLDIVDIDFISDRKTQFPAKQRLRTEQIISTDLFRNWIVLPSSAKLLIKWDSHRPRTIGGISPLSVFCTTMAQALQTKENFVSLLWFCGRHMDEDEGSSQVGAIPMITSLIDQLLRQHAFELRLLHQEIDLEGVGGRNLDALTKLLGWLIRRLPGTVTVVCIIDGVAFFEREEFLEDSLTAFGNLLGLTVDQSVTASVKVMFTSTPGPECVQLAFENEGLILNVDTLPQMPWAPNDERIARSLEDHHEEE